MVNTYRRIIVILEEPWQQIVDRRELPPVLRRAPSSHWSRHCLLVIFLINIIEILLQVSTRASVVKITASSKLETTAILESDTEVDSQQL